jgi:hypothetical protein
VQGANFDVGAVVQIGVTEVVGGNEVTTFTDVATFSHKGLSTDWYGVPETEMAYPIRHYLSTVALPGVQPAGATLKLRVRNLDGQTSKEEFPYILPADAAHVDSDGDGLLDSWETNGYDADHDGTVDVNLPALGTDPYRRDILLELDIMDNLRYRPGPEVFDGARALFRSAPILNPFSDSGINLILDTSGKPCLRNPEGVDVCSFQEVVFDTQFMLPFIGNTQGEDPFGRGSVRFSELKRHNFDNAKRDQIFHYGIWGINLSFGVSGMSDFADDFVVTMDGDAFGASYQTNRSRVEELTHELGHDLRQLHGGTDNQAYKPTYLSVMSYIWDLRTSWWDRKIDQPDNKRRVARPTCLPFYYASRGADEVGGAVPPTVNGVKTADYTVVDYSEGMGKAIDRPVSPPGGPRGPLPKICGKDVTWENLPLDPATIRIEDFPNWRDLKFDGPGLNGWPDMDGILP